MSAVDRWIAGKVGMRSGCRGRQDPSVENADSLHVVGDLAARMLLAPAAACLIPAGLEHSGSLSGIAVQRPLSPGNGARSDASVYSWHRRHGLPHRPHLHQMYHTLIHGPRHDGRGCDPSAEERGEREHRGERHRAKEWAVYTCAGVAGSVVRHRRSLCPALLLAPMAPASELERGITSPSQYL